MYTIITSLKCRFVDRQQTDDRLTAIEFANYIVKHLFGGCDTAEVYYGDQLIYTAHKED